MLFLRRSSLKILVEVSSMAIMGTKKYWINSPGKDTSQKDEQILKNSGYINIQLRSFYYNSKGNNWQRFFGGSDKVVLSTNIKYQYSGRNIESSTIQDIREVHVRKKEQTFDFALQRNIAIRIPAHADALEFKVQITGRKKDRLEEAFNMLNSSEFQTALEMAPQVVGQVITVTSLIKKLFTESELKDQLEATYAGIISSENETNPVGNGKLTQGFLILISLDDDPSFFRNVDESKFSLQGNMMGSLYYDGKKLENSTYIVLLISFENNRGPEEGSEWYKKYRQALSHLESLRIANEMEIENIRRKSIEFWIQGNALLEVDNRYVNREKDTIREAMITKIYNRYQELTEKFRIPLDDIVIDQETLDQISPSATPRQLSIALPKTVAYIEESFNIDKDKTFDDKDQPFFSIEGPKALELLESDKQKYMQELEAEGKSFKLLE